MDKFHEQLVTTSKTSKYKITNFLAYFFGIIGLMYVFVNLIMAILFILLAVGMHFLKKKFFVEFEYTLTNGDVDIDKIIEMKKRKRVISFNMKDVQMLAPEDSYYIKDFSNKPQKVLICYPETCDRKIYVAIISGNNNIQLKFAPEESLIDLLHMYNPRAVKKN